MLMDLYIAKELDNIDDWIENIMNINKVMESLHTEIHKLKDQAHELILDAEKHYSDACLDIYEDNTWEKLILVGIVVEKFWNFFDEVYNDEEALLELDVILRDFVETRIEVDDYKKKVKEKYNAFDLPVAVQVTKIIDKFKGKYPDIALV